MVGTGGFRQGLKLPHCFLTLPSARKESAKEKQLKEEEKILESVAEGRGEWWELRVSQACIQSCQGSGRGVACLAALGDVHTWDGTGDHNRVLQSASKLPWLS